MNKNRLIILLAFLLGTTWFYAQGPARERIKTLKVAFITERIGLTSQEAQSFWPIYNEHEEKLEAIRRKERHERISFADNLSNNEASDLLDRLIALQTEKHEANRFFLSKIRKVLSPNKTLLLLKAEEDFKKRLLQQYRKRKGGG
ncbi:Spy/CpxP family protein refolding chaperone [Flagellimonas nanhaiensis]|uniref:Sensor of ECF-type sigma factor n=1 Tax=Flagellimonas nanhaiensis TaxID=2292706 RepID=A0A371JTS7_9FLAO|nr:hypothetical protein [Allomuricauda nanhaiensis]RDY61222.1 hypothetical protein DX873_03370 [Allomuricauda nanhaiensis]